MNNLQKLITEYTVDNKVFSEETFYLMFLLLIIIIVLLILLPQVVVVVIIFSFVFYVFSPTSIFKTNTPDKSVILKENYNIEMKEKDELIELGFNKKKKSTGFLKDNFKDNFKVYLEKTNEEKYYIYFDENKKDKKEVSLNEIKETFGNIKRVETKKFSLSELNDEERNW